MAKRLDRVEGAASELWIMQHLAPPVGAARAAFHQAACLVALLVVVFGDAGAFVGFTTLWLRLFGFGGWCWLCICGI